MDTNFDQPSPEDTQTFKAWSPHAPRPPVQFQPPGVVMAPLPRPQPTADAQREKELQDRRRNWVFMTAEDFASPDGKKDGLGNDDKDKKSMTAMERYYQRLYDSDHAAATNQFDRPEMDRLNARTNLVGGEVRNPDRGVFTEVPFSPTSEFDVFQPMRRSGGFADVFSSDTRDTMPTPETVRVEAEQKAHMESFKQLWNIDQPPAAAPVSSSASTPVDSGPLFGLSSPGVQSVNPLGSLDGGHSAQQSQTPAPAVPSPRISRPPHADFAAPQRPF